MKYQSVVGCLPEAVLDGPENLGRETFVPPDEEQGAVTCVGMLVTIHIRAEDSGYTLPCFRISRLEAVEQPLLADVPRQAGQGGDAAPCASRLFHSFMQQTIEIMLNPIEVVPVLVIETSLGMSPKMRLGFSECVLQQLPSELRPLVH